MGKQKRGNETAGPTAKSSGLELQHLAKLSRQL
jgi:hypothetical protein